MTEEDEVVVNENENQQSNELEQLRTELEQTNEQLDQVRFEKTLAVELTREGVIDLDAALKLATSEGEPQEVAAELKKQKPYLFGKPAQTADAISMGAKMKRRNNSYEQLDKIAELAKASGSRKDLYEYLKLRRRIKRS